MIKVSKLVTSNREINVQVFILVAAHRKKLALKRKLTKTQ